MSGASTLDVCVLCVLEAAVLDVSVHEGGT